MAKPKQARLDSFFSPRGQDVQPSKTSIRPMPTEEIPITPTVSTDWKRRRNGSLLMLKNMCYHFTNFGNPALYHYLVTTKFHSFSLKFAGVRLHNFLS